MGKFFAIVGLKDNSGQRFGRALTKAARDVGRGITVRVTDPLCYYTHGI